VAVTESAFVSRAFGLDQGFDWFEEHDMLASGIERTMASARAQLALDDGRPLFLFVHTYRTHIPYTVSDTTRERLGSRYDFSQDSMELLLRLGDWPRPIADGKPASGERADFIAALEDLYRGGVADLDRAFGFFLGDLERAGVLGTGVLAFTSDHGEAFGEHGRVFHMGCIWDEVARVPLLLHAPGLVPGDERDPVGLVDLAPTLCRLAGIEPRTQWMGRDILASDPMPVLTYQCDRKKGSFLAVVQGNWKLILPDTGGASEKAPLRFAYDVTRDPGERKNRRTDPGARRLLREFRPRLAALSMPLFEHSEQQISPALAAQLRALGYLGDEDEVYDEDE
jgi:arylsulfatase A-like enzyme